MPVIWTTETPNTKATCPTRPDTALPSDASELVRHGCCARRREAFARGPATSTGKDAGKGRAAASPPSFDLFETFGYIEKYPSQGKLSEGVDENSAALA